MANVIIIHHGAKSGQTAESHESSNVIKRGGGNDYAGAEMVDTT